MRSFQCFVITVLFSLTWRTIDAVANGEAKGDGNELKTAFSSVSSNKQMGIKQANLFDNRKLHGLFARVFRRDLIFCCDSLELPSSVPSSVPSKSPSPSSVPSEIPSSVPSKSPKPSLKPSSKPSLAPSQHPSSKPSLKPSSKPSLAPSQHPNSKPSLEPSVSPAPSLKPSQFPSIVPSLKPSQFPSIVPSVSPAPSLKPSQVPSAVPTKSPEPTNPFRFSSFRLSDTDSGSCNCLSVKSDNTVEAAACDSVTDDDSLWMYDKMFDPYLKLKQGTKANWCLSYDGNKTPVITSDCNDDVAKIEFWYDGGGGDDDRFLKQGGLFLAFDDATSSLKFLADFSKRVTFDIGCECDSCPDD